MPHKSLWAQAFIDQARLDVQLAVALYSLVKDKTDQELLGSRPELYCPAIYAYCQQAIEKALKAWLWLTQGSIPMDHNPLRWVLDSDDMKKFRDIKKSGGVKKHNGPAHLEMIDRNSNYLRKLLDMAPGAGIGRNATKEARLSKCNTEYPYASGDTVKLPSDTIKDVDVVAAFKYGKPLVEEIRKYIEVQNRSPRLSNHRLFP